MSYKIFIDSCADLPIEYVREKDLGLSMMLYTIDGKESPDDLGESCSYHEFYEQMRGGAGTSTSQINAESFKEDWSPYLQQGTDILYPCFSSALSSTYQSALMAREDLLAQYPDRKILVVDTKAASSGLGLIVSHVVKMKEQGRSIEETAQWIGDNLIYLNHWFTVDDLVYLRRSGRLSSAAAFVGSILQLKPVLHVDGAGRLVPVFKIRGRSKALTTLCDQMLVMTQGIDDIGPVYISHADAREDAQKLADDIRARIGVSDITLMHIGPTVGSHSGPGTVALFFMGKAREDFNQAKKKK
ncbi:MAG: DegV family protein [Christensenellales bacterium]|jgi:DegV family protein with EDD domain